MKKIVVQVFSLLMVLLMVTFTGCQKTDLYQAGLEVTVLMGEMVSNEDYVNMYGSDINIEKVRAKDYDTPIKVYNITQPIFEKAIEEFARKNSTIKETYEKLPDSLKEQLKWQVNFSSIINTLRYEIESDFDDFEISVLSNIFIAQKRKTGTIERATAYLYVFETGQPILVEFTPIGNKEYNMVGRFFLIKECNTLSDVRTLLEPYGCEVSVIKG